MDNGSTRVEIELEPQEPKRSRRRAAREAPAAVVLDAPPMPAIEPAPPAGAPRRQLVVTALAVGLVALFLGWVLGRSGGDDTEARTGGSAPATTASPGTTAAPSTSAVSDETLPAAELPATTRPPRTTTTTLPPAWTESLVALDPRLAGLTGRLVVVTDSHVVSVVDLADGSMRRIELPRLTGTTVGVVAGDDWVMVPDDNGGAPLVVRDDGSIERPDEFTDPWSTFWEFGTDGFWTAGYDPRLGRVSTAELRTVDGVETGIEISTRGRWITGSDPAGGVIVTDYAGGLFRVAADGSSSRIADGAMLSISATHVLVHRCGDDLDSCEVVLVDRATREERVVPTSDETTLSLSYGGWFGGPLMVSTLNADGTAALVSLPGSFGPPSVGVLDTATGEIDELTSPLSDGTAFQPYSGAAWSSEGRVAFVTLANDVYAYDRDTGDLFPVTADGTFERAGVLTIAPA